MLSAAKKGEASSETSTPCWSLTTNDTWATPKKAQTRAAAKSIRRGGLSL